MSKPEEEHGVMVVNIPERKRGKRDKLSDVADVLLPEAVIERLQARSDTETADKFADGDDCAVLVEEFGPRHGKSRVRKRIAIERGVAVSTMRDREAMAKFFPPEIRDEFEVLTYHQFRACKAAGSNWREFAEWAVKSMDDYGGRPAPVDVIRQKMRKADQTQPTWERRLLSMSHLAEQLVEDPATKRSVKKAASDFLEAVSRTVRALENGEGDGQ